VRTEKFSAEQVASALTQTRGMITLAAQMLHCDYNTIRRYIKNYPTVAQAQVDARAVMVDAVELKLYDSIMRGDTTAAIFFLKTQAKDRGYTERLEIDMRYVPMVKQIEQLAAAHGTSAGDLFNDIISELSAADSPATDH